MMSYVIILNNSSSGCMINFCRLNYLFYADDSVILGPSPRSLRGLIDLCLEYVGNHELPFNIKKTKVMCFKPKCLSNIHIPDFTLIGSKLEMVSTRHIWVVLFTKTLL